MIDTYAFWILMLTLSTLFQAFYTMVEMAAVSLNKIHLAYLSSIEVPWAKQLTYLLGRPYRLFGAVMIGANLSLQLHSHCAREMYEACSLNPDSAPFLQLLLTIFFVELIPSILGRHHAETIAKWCVPAFYLCYRLFSPLIFICSVITRIHLIFQPKKWNREIPALSVEELSALLPEKEKRGGAERLIRNILYIHDKKIEEIALPIEQITHIPSHESVKEAKKTLKHVQWPYLLTHDSKGINGVASFTDLVEKNESTPLSALTTKPWTLNGDTLIRTALSSFKTHPQGLALITDRKNEPKKFLTLELLLNNLAAR